jgi:hypothetical protein
MNDYRYLSDSLWSLITKNCVGSEIVIVMTVKNVVFLCVCFWSRLPHSRSLLICFMRPIFLISAILLIVNQAIYSHALKCNSKGNTNWVKAVWIVNAVELEGDLFVFIFEICCNYENKSRNRSCWINKYWTVLRILRKI